MKWVQIASGGKKWKIEIRNASPVSPDLAKFCALAKFGIVDQFVFG